MTSTFQPNWISPPGDTIIDILEENGWTQAEFAKRCGYNKKHINLLVNGKASITEDTALRLEKVLGSTAGFWLRREALYRGSLARRVETEELSKQAPWLKKIPLGEMIKFGWIKEYTDKGMQVRECLEFFGVSSSAIWETQYQQPIAAFRASKTYEKKIPSTTAWLRQGERSAAKIFCEDYDKEEFKNVLFEIRTLTNEVDPNIFIPRLKELCSKVGVAFVFERTPKGCPVSGVTKWLSPNKALIMLSLRHKTNDHLWFSFFHEAAHILLHGKKLLFLKANGLNSEEENEADKFASDFLIPRKEAKRLLEIPHTYDAVKKIALELGIPPAIVVGRMQHDKILSYGKLNKVKVSYSWANEK